ncbi:hypothetical protein ACFO3J_19540 [Streptomyces polygonati]|uniref:Uncharacterized protein n=1 Tax=Streptomyces polygonati TaxID=1617087 RepID=A0ABV8HTM2_9ACTN
MTSSRTPGILSRGTLSPPSEPDASTARTRARAGVRGLPPRERRQG